MHRTLIAVLSLAAAPALAADPDMAAQCAACHGEAGVSVAADIPNLAAQKADYIVAQLEAFRAGERTNPLMNAIAAQLDDGQIESLAAHFSALPGAAPDAVGTMSAALAGDRPHFPGDYAESFTRYHTIDFPERKQVRHYWANDAALEAARAGGPFPPGAYLFVEVHKAELDAAGAPVTGPDGRFAEKASNLGCGGRAMTASSGRAGIGSAVRLGSTAGTVSGRPAPSGPPGGDGTPSIRGMSRPMVALNPAGVVPGGS
jgi:cytochrome c553